MKSLFPYTCLKVMRSSSAPGFLQENNYLTTSSQALSSSTGHARLWDRNCRGSTEVEWWGG